MELTYTRNGDYLIPDIELEKQPTESIGKYGRMRKQFLKENRKGTYSHLLLTGELTAHLIEIDRTAKEQIERTVSEMAKTEGLTEKLKATDQMRWVGLMNNLIHSAEEIILPDLIYG